MNVFLVDDHLSLLHFSLVERSIDGRKNRHARLTQCNQRPLIREIFCDRILRQKNNGDRIGQETNGRHEKDVGKCCLHNNSMDPPEQTVVIVLI